MINLFPTKTLFSRTALVLALAFSFFALFSVAMLQYTLVQPQTRQAADDLAAFIVLSAQIWVELPPNVRPDFEKELFNRHNLKIIKVEAPHPINARDHIYLDYLTESLEKRLNRHLPIHRHEAHSEWLWVDFPMGGHVIRLGFHEARLKSHMLLTVITVLSLGILLAFIISLKLVRRVAQPLKNMAETTSRIGEGDFGMELPETGPEEIAKLARTINQMEKRIQQLLENRTTLLAGISHDLRTPLARIRLELEMLDGQYDEKRITAIDHDLSEMDHLISQTLLLARGLDEEEKTRIDVNQVILSVTDNLRRGNAEINFKPAKECIHLLRVDALKRVLNNLIENALIYSDGLPVNVTCNCNSQAGTTITVSDQGPGIPLTEHKAVFQPFYRLEGSRSKATGGSGLGLAIVRQLCDANGWNTEISSPARGGTKVKIQLPRPDDQG